MSRESSSQRRLQFSRDEILRPDWLSTERRISKFVDAAAVKTTRSVPPDFAEFVDLRMELLSEFDPALPMGANYCSNQLSAEEYEQQGSDATRQALLELQEVMKQNPELYRQVLGKKRIDEGNVFSKLKGKFMTAVKGDEYGKEKVTELETQVKMAELHEEMFKVFDYAQEEKTMTRKSQRLAEKRAKKVKEQPAVTPEKSSSGEGDTYTTPPQFVPPPPPPYPPPVVGTPMALRERTNMQSTPAPTAKKRVADKNGPMHGSSTSINSVHSELLASNQMLRLRPTRVKRMNQKVVRRNLLVDLQEAPRSTAPDTPALS
ncbi:uncharacterized protein LOC144915673 isoform X2 [Branchiostoma floridae x Branchiostoma belcheri]